MHGDDPVEGTEASEPGPAVDRRPRRGLDDRALAAVVVAIGALIRLGWALSRRDAEFGGDAYYFHNQANLLASGRGFIEPLTWAVEGRAEPAAAHPPLHSVYLALWSLAGVRSVSGHLVAAALLGTATVALVLAAGWRLGGPRVGLLAGLAAALHPNLWVWDGMLLSETTAAFTVALFLWCAVRQITEPSWRHLLLTAGAVGLGALSRSELLLLVVVLVPLARRLPQVDGSWRRTLAPAAAGAGVALAVIAPWALHNQTRFEHPVPLSTGAGLVLVSSNCETTYAGPLTGYWDFDCSVDGAARAGVDSATDASEGDRLMRADAVEFARDHPGRLAPVAAARAGRVVAVYRPFQQIVLLEESEGIPTWIGAASLGSWFLLVGLAVVGVRALRRDRVPVAALIAPVLVVLVVAVAVYGIWRFRAPGDVAVCLLAGVGADALLRRTLDGAPAAPTPSPLD